MNSAVPFRYKTPAAIAEAMAAGHFAFYKAGFLCLYLFCDYFWKNIGTTLLFKKLGKLERITVYSFKFHPFI